jgi:hypothetical protein
VWRASEKWFSSGLLVGALFTGVVLFLPLALLSGWMLPVAVRAALFVALAGAVLLDASGLRHVTFPQNARQVPQAIAHTDPAIGAFRFGVEMGTGLRTFSPSGLPHLLLAGLLVVGQVGVVVLAAVGFALGRALMTRGAILRPEAWVTGWDAMRVPVTCVGVGMVLLPVVAWAVA